MKLYSDSEKTLEISVIDNILSLSGYMSLEDVKEVKVEKIYWDWPYQTGKTEEEILENDLIDSEFLGKVMTMKIAATGTEILNEKLSIIGDNNVDEDKTVQLSTNIINENIKWESSNESIASYVSAEDELALFSVNGLENEKISFVSAYDEKTKEAIDFIEYKENANYYNKNGNYVTGSAWVINTDNITNQSATYSLIVNFVTNDNKPFSVCYKIDFPCLVKDTEILVEEEDERKRRRKNKYNLLKFSDGTELRTVNQHRIFNIEKGMFTYPMTDDTPIGTTTFNAEGKKVKLISKEIIMQEVSFYNIITKYHMNAFANGILTSCRLSNLYKVQNMKYVKDNRVLAKREEYLNVEDEYYYGLRLSEQPKQLNRGNDVVYEQTIEEYINRCINISKEK